MTQTTKRLPVEETELAQMTIREMTEIEPRTLDILGPLGIDLCCGGAHPLGEALELHGFDRSVVMPQLLALARAE